MTSRRRLSRSSSALALRQSSMPQTSRERVLFARRAGLNARVPRVRNADRGPAAMSLGYARIRPTRVSALA